MPEVAGEEERLRAEVVRLNKMVNALMNRAERDMNGKASEFGMFQTAVTLENEVRTRTAELEQALRDNEKMNRALQRAKEQMEREKEEQAILIKKLEEAHNQLLQSEKLASIGQLAAGVAHEINNPIGFVSSNLGVLKTYVGDLMRLLDIYAEAEPLLGADPALAERVRAAKSDIELDYLREDIEQLLAESTEGTERVRRIVRDLKDFSRPAAEAWEWADLHAGIDSTLNVVWNEIKYKAVVKKEFGDLPAVECRLSQLNQVFMNLLVNAAHAIAQQGVITIRSGRDGDWVWIAISDTGCGIPAEIRDRIFDPFFTTKPVGTGTGLGLSISYGIIDKHGGRIEVNSEPGQGTTFTIHLPIQRAVAQFDPVI